MEDFLLNETVNPDDLRNFEREYHNELSSGNVQRETQFSYAWCLVRSLYAADIRKGIVLLEELFKTEVADNGQCKRDYLYYLALGNARIKEYTTALQYTRAFLQVEPANQQVKNLETMIQKKLEIEGLKGMAIVGGGILLGIGALVGMGMALGKGKKK